MARTSAPSLLKTVTGRKLAGIAVLLVIGNAVVYWQGNTQDWTARVSERQILARSVATAFVSQIDGDAHRDLARGGPAKARYDSWNDAPDAAWMHHVAMAGLRDEGNLGGELYTLHLRDDLRRQVESYPDQLHAEALFVLFSSEDPPTWKALVDYTPAMKPAFFGGSNDAPDPASVRTAGTVTGYAPLRDSLGNTVGLLAVDLPLDTGTGPHTGWQTQLGLVLGGLTFALLMLLLHTARRITGGLHVLEDASARLAAGDLQTVVTDQGHREVSSVGHALEDARAALSHREEQLRSYAEGMQRENDFLQRGLDAATRRRRNALLEHSDEVSTTITVAGDTAPVRLVDLSYDFVLVHARKETTIVPGTPLDLEIVVAADGERVQLACAAQAVEPTDDAVSIRLASRHSTERLRFPRRLVELTRLRLAQRARPRSRHPISVTCGFDGMSITGTVVDLSAAGMAVMTPTSADTLASAGVVGRLRFDLPGPSEPIQVRGTLLRMQETAEGTLLGFGFRFRGRRGSGAHQQTIESWVDKRVREETAADKASRSAQRGGGSTGLPV